MNQNTPPSAHNQSGEHEETNRNWDQWRGTEIRIPNFFQDDATKSEKGLYGFVQGNGPGYSPNKPSSIEAIGVYTTEGRYYTFKIDKKVKCDKPQFTLDFNPLYYAIFDRATVNDGQPCVNPENGAFCDSPKQPTA